MDIRMTGVTYTLGNIEEISTYMSGEYVFPELKVEWGVVINNKTILSMTYATGMSYLFNDMRCPNFELEYFEGDEDLRELADSVYIIEEDCYLEIKESLEKKLNTTLTEDEMLALNKMLYENRPKTEDFISLRIEDYEGRKEIGIKTFLFEDYDDGEDYEEYYNEK